MKRLVPAKTSHLTKRAYQNANTVVLVSKGNTEELNLEEEEVDDYRDDPPP
jgi:hypothetical protein